jgi:hypothetical protein
VYEHERARPHFVSPIYASNPGNEFLKKIIVELGKVTVKTIETKKVIKLNEEFDKIKNLFSYNRKTQ